MQLDTPTIPYSPTLAMNLVDVVGKLLCSGPASLHVGRLEPLKPHIFMSDVFETTNHANTAAKSPKLAW